MNFYLNLCTRSHVRYHTTPDCNHFLAVGVITLLGRKCGSHEVVDALYSLLYNFCDFYTLCPTDPHGAPHEPGCGGQQCDGPVHRHGLPAPHGVPLHIGHPRPPGTFGFS